MRNQSKENNNAWVGDRVKYPALHRYLRTHYPPPDRCQKCFKVGSVDLANKDGIYKRDIKHFEYICRKCHVHSDKRIIVMKEFSYHKGHHNEMRWNNPLGCHQDKLGNYIAQIRKDKKTYYLGYFKTKELAASAYKEKKKELYGYLFLPQI